MKKEYFGLFAISLICTIGFLGCLTATSSVRGTTTTISTAGGDRLEAIVLLQNTWERARIARSNNDVYYLYVDIKTNNRTRPGNVLIYTDGIRHTIANTADWNFTNISISQTGNVVDRTTVKRLEPSVIEAIINANTVIIRAVGGNSFMGKENGVNISAILPVLKEFISK